MLKDKLQHIHVKMNSDETENSLLLYIFSALIEEKKIWVKPERIYSPHRMFHSD